uniref:Uncharacterized protein n=1 Tax=Cacopsylla melanoneura TaxID=428564 RepID=A0A8D8TH93_9HEMI
MVGTERMMKMTSSGHSPEPFSILSLSSLPLAMVTSRPKRRGVKWAPSSTLSSVSRSCSSACPTLGTSWRTVSGLFTGRSAATRAPDQGNHQSSPEDRRVYALTMVGCPPDLSPLDPHHSVVRSARPRGPRTTR